MPAVTPPLGRASSHRLLSQGPWATDQSTKHQLSQLKPTLQDRCERQRGTVHLQISIQQLPPSHASTTCSLLSGVARRTVTRTEASLGKIRVTACDDRCSSLGLRHGARSLWTHYRTERPRPEPAIVISSPQTRTWDSRSSS